MSSAPPPNPAVPPSRPAQRSGPAAVLASLLKGPISALHVLLLSLIAVAVALLLCILLAFNVLPGYPDSAEKNVTVYSQTGPSSPALSFYLNPPLNALQAERRIPTPGCTSHQPRQHVLNVTGLDASPESCFYVESSDRSPRVPTPTARFRSPLAGPPFSCTASTRGHPGLYPPVPTHPAGLLEGHHRRRI